MQENLIYLKDCNSGQIIKSFSLDQSALAFEEAGRWEDLGVEVMVSAPTILDDLATSFKLSMDETRAFQASVDSELEDHDGSCICKPIK